VSEVSVELKPIGSQGKIQISIAMPDGETLTDTLNVAMESARRKFLEKLAAKATEDLVAAVALRLEECARMVVTSATPVNETSQADEIVALAAGAELFHAPGDKESMGYVSIEVDGRRENWPLESGVTRRWIAKLLYDKRQKTPNKSAIDDALTILSAKANFEGPEHPVYVRVAGFGNDVYLDLGDKDWQVVRVTAQGWQVIPGKDAPVRFIRRRGMLPIPVPTTGGNLEQLRQLMNLEDEDAWTLVVGFLLACLMPSGPYPILLIDGEQGSAKSTTSRMICGLIDPRKPVYRRPPKSERDLMIGAANGWLIAYDNLSGIEPWLSDAICMLATGGGFASRELFKDGDEKIFDATRPVLMNGIDSISSRSDLLDRALRLHLPRLDEAKIRPKQEIDADFQRILPGVLGALLTATSAAIRGHRDVKLERLPRMADFTRWVVAAEPALGWRLGAFLDAYMRSRNEADAAAIESSPVGRAVLAFARAVKTWRGTATELLCELNGRAADSTQSELPQKPESLSKLLLRVAPNLRRFGVEVEFERNGAQRSINLTSRVASGDGSMTVDDGSTDPNRHCESGSGSTENEDRDGYDGCDSFPGHFPEEASS